MASFGWMARLSGVDLANPIENVVAANNGVAPNDPTVPGFTAAHAGSEAMHVVVGATDNPTGGSGGVHVLTSFAAGGDAPSKVFENFLSNSHYTFSVAVGRMAVAGGTLADFIATATKSGVTFHYLTWLASTTVLKPASEGGTITVATNAAATAGSGTLTPSLTAGAGLYYFVGFTDTAGGIIAPPDGTWTLARHSTIAGFGELWAYTRPHSAETGTFSPIFTVGSNAAPSITGQPWITGSASGSSSTGRAGETLTLNLPTISGSPTPTVTIQWTEDGTDIPGANLATLTPSSDSSQHVYGAHITASNGVGSNATATTSNTKTVPPRPTNVTRPIIHHADGTLTDADPYRAGQDVTWTDGVFNDAETFSYQVYRGSSPVTGQTAKPYTLQVSDQGASIRVGVIAHGPGGDSAEVLSDPVVPVVEAQLSDESFLVYYSGGAGNTNPANSIGGGRGGTYPGGLDDLVGPLSDELAQTGGSLFRGVYARNTSTLYSALSGIAYALQEFASGQLHVRVGVPVQGVGVDLPVLADQFTAPAGVTFTAAGDVASGLPFGDLGPGQLRGLWIEVVVDPNAPFVASDAADVVVEFVPG